MGVRIDEKLPEKHDANDERAFSYMGLSPGQSGYDHKYQVQFEIKGERKSFRMTLEKRDQVK
ncbi:hypothetical protein [Bacillus cereus]|uniref:hypothetical protein n=1 Tax=Bacillus cereus TaxID=1396 RepID=UPI00311FBDB1